MVVTDDFAEEGTGKQRVKNELVFSSHSARGIAKGVWDKGATSAKTQT